MTFKERMLMGAMREVAKNELSEFTLMMELKDKKMSKIIKGSPVQLMMAISESVVEIADMCNAEVSEVLEELALLCESYKKTKSKIKK